MKAIGTRSVSTIALVAGVAGVVWSTGIVRVDYWAQLSPLVLLFAGCFAVIAATVVVRFWRLGARSEYYIRVGEPLAWGAETVLVGTPRFALLVGHPVQPAVFDLSPRVQRALYLVIFFGLGLVTFTNRAIALLGDVPDRITRPSTDVCAEPAPPKIEHVVPAGCKLVQRAYKLGYVKKLGSCAPTTTTEIAVRDVCRKRQSDEPYLHYTWRLFETNLGKLVSSGGPTIVERMSEQLPHLDAMFHAIVDSVAMRPRSSHHVFTNLPDPRPGLGARMKAALERGGCGARLAHLPQFPHIAEPARLFEHVLAKLLFDPSYKPVVAQCEEIVVHWDAPLDACARLAAQPVEFLADHGALQSVRDVLAWRQRKLELERLARRPVGDIAAADRIVSFQCVMIDTAETATPIDRATTLDGTTFHVRETRTRPIGGNDADQIRLYKHLAAVLVTGFSYGRLTSNQAFGVEPAEAAMADAFRDKTFALAKLDLLVDADLFIGNDWLAERPDLLEVYPYHLHLQNFVEIFRRQYKLHRGRL
jgi:hypothetical protein